jgi:hypothetical protein
MLRSKLAVAGWGVMLVGIHNKQRTDCPLCTVTAVFPGEDNGLRVVKLKVSLAELIGPVQYIQQLEVDSESDGRAKPKIGAILDTSVQDCWGGDFIRCEKSAFSLPVFLSRFILDEESKGGKMLST